MWGKHSQILEDNAHPHTKDQGPVKCFQNVYILPIFSEHLRIDLVTCIKEVKESLQLYSPLMSPPAMMEGKDREGRDNYRNELAM